MAFLTTERSGELTMNDGDGYRTRGFRNRVEAGKVLADALERYRESDDTVVLGLPRGGMTVAAEVAGELDLPLDVLTVRKLGTPGHEELAMGAIASGGTVVLDHALIEHLHISDEKVREEIREEKEELERSEALYRDDGGPIPIRGKRVIVVDDGAATGSTLLSAIGALRSMGADSVIAAVPVASPEAKRAFEEKADKVVCSLVPAEFYAVGVWYDDFRPVTNEEVRRMLREGRHSAGRGSGDSGDRL